MNPNPTLAYLHGFITREQFIYLLWMAAERRKQHQQEPKAMEKAAT
jgi:hypothetical protein